MAHMTNTVFNEIQDYLKDQKLDIELLVDASGSMKQGNRIAQAKEIARTVAKVAALVDEDGGIGLTHFAGWPSTNTWEDVKTDAIDGAFEKYVASGPTDTLRFLESEVEQHYSRKAGNPSQKTMIICITDGEPAGGKTEMDRIEARLTELCSAIDFTPQIPELKVLFWQVGDDSAAATFLKRLDDCAGCGKLVDTYVDGSDNSTIEQVLLNALKDR